MGNAPPSNVNEVTTLMYFKNSASLITVADFVIFLLPFILIETFRGFLSFTRRMPVDIKTKTLADTLSSHTDKDRY